MIEHFSTRDVAKRERLDYWNRIAAGQSAGLMIDSPNDDFLGQLGCWTLRNITILKARAETSIVSRSARQDEEERLLVHLQTRGLDARDALPAPYDPPRGDSSGLSRDHAKLGCQKASEPGQPT